MALERVEKQPADVQDFDADFSAFLNDLGDTGESATVVVADGITLDTHTLITSTADHEVSGIVDGVVKVWLSGGTTGNTYKVTVTLTTTGGRVRQYEFNCKVKEL